MKCALDSGADVNHRDDPVLYHALYYGNIVISRLLLSSGAKAMAKDGRFLAMATEVKNLELLRLILDQPGVNVNAENGSALFVAFKDG